jgi:hypothetical protein
LTTCKPGGEFLTAKKLDVKIKKAVGFCGSKWSVLRILKSMGFRNDMQ